MVGELNTVFVLRTSESLQKRNTPLFSCFLIAPISGVGPQTANKDVNEKGSGWSLSLARFLFPPRLKISATFVCLFCFSTKDEGEVQVNQRDAINEIQIHATRNSAERNIPDSFPLEILREIIVSFSYSSSLLLTISRRGC